MDAEDTARLAGILSAEARVSILLLLKERALCVGALAERLGISSAAVSQHECERERLGPEHGEASRRQED